MANKDKQEKTTLHFLDNSELYYLRYEILPTWDFGRNRDVEFSVFNSSDVLVYRNIIGIVNDRRDEDIELTIRYFLRLWNDDAPLSNREGDYFLSNELRGEYQFPGYADDRILAALVIKTIEAFGSYRPGEGLLMLDLMISLDVNRQSLLRAINRLIERDIIEILRDAELDPRYVISDYDRADNYVRGAMAELPPAQPPMSGIERKIGFIRNQLSGERPND